MIRNVLANKILWILTSCLVIITAGIGVSNAQIYQGLVDPAIIPGVFTQDLLALFAGIILLILAMRLSEEGYRTLIVGLGILGFFFYAYGIYSIEQIYNWFYPAYLAIFALSVYSMILGFSSINGAAFKSVTMPSWLRYSSAFYAVLIAIMFNIIWFSALVPLLRTGDRIENTFSIFIIDLCFIMPGFVISAILSLRRKPLGEIGLPSLYVLGIGILSPLALAEFIKPARYGMSVDTGQFWLYLVLSIGFLLWTVIHLRLYRARQV